MSNIGILVHGRHVGALGWEKLMWGCPTEDKFGSLTRMVLEVLDRGQENIGTIIFGTGTSEHDGLKEAECMKQYLQKNFTKLSEFSTIKEHPRFQSSDDIAHLSKLIDNIFCEIKSKNTAQEVRNAAKIFAKNDCKEIYHISCSSHISRCVLDMKKAWARGEIPKDQRWYGAPDDMTFEGTSLEDVVVVEPPHRGDDPRLKEKIQMKEVIIPLFRLSSKDRTECLGFYQTILKAYSE